ncbi:hypothetical protein [Cohnella sp. GCM10012308]|uniref:hypothetical protein n=1 Tax=Cohnella sp. GCM10012308 TaxID=3317329 RepID=UPI00360BBD55
MYGSRFLVKSCIMVMVAALLLTSFVYPAGKSEAMASGIDLFVNTTVSSANTTVVKSGAGTVGTAMTITAQIGNNGDTPTPAGQNVTVKLYIDGDYISSQQIAPPGSGFNMAVNASGQAWSLRYLTWTWTPTKDGNHLIQYEIVNNYGDVLPPNNHWIYTAAVTDATAAVLDTVDFGNGGSETSHGLSSNGGGTGAYNESIGKIAETNNYHNAGSNAGDWFGVNMANNANRYGTLAIREIHPSGSANYRKVLNNPDQTGSGSSGIPIDVNATGQTFTTGPNTTYIPSIAVQLEKVGLVNTSASMDLTLTLWDSPYKHQQLAQSTLLAQSVQGGYAWEIFNFAEDVGVLPGNEYYMEFTTSKPYDTNNRYILYGYNASSYAGGTLYAGGAAVSGKTLSFKTGPNIPTSYDIQVGGQQVGGTDQSSTGSGFAALDVNNATPPGQTFAVGNTTELQAIALQVEKAGAIPADNALVLTLYDTPTTSDGSYLATQPWSTGVIGQAVLSPGEVPGGYNWATFVFPQKVLVYPGRTYYFEVTTVKAFDSSKRFVLGFYTTSAYNRGTLYTNRALQSGQALSFKTSHNPLFKTRNLYDRGIGALTHFVDLPQLYAGSSIAVKVVNQLPGSVNNAYIDKMWNYAGFDTYASRYDVPMYFSPLLGRANEDSTTQHFPEQVNVIKNNVITRTDNYLGGNAIKPGFSLEEWYAKNTLNVQTDINYVLGVAKTAGIPVNLYLNSTWGGTPNSPYNSILYDQILFSGTDNYGDPDMNLLAPSLNYATDPHYGRTIPNIWGNTSWLTFNNGGFANPASGTLNRFKKDRLGLSTDQLNKNMLDLANSNQDNLLLSVSGDNEPAYWAYQMDTDSAPDHGYASVNGGNMRVRGAGDFGPDAVAQAGADGVTLNPYTGNWDTMKQWWQTNLNNYNQFIYGNMNRGLYKPVTKINDNAITYATDGVKHNLFTQNPTYPTYPLFDIYHAGYEAAVVNEAATGIESYFLSNDYAHAQRIINNVGRTANLNQEHSGLPLGGYDKNMAGSFMLGLRYVTLYNVMSISSPYYDTSFTAFNDKASAFSGDPIRIATLVNQRRKNLTIAAERDAVRLKNAFTLLPGDTLASTKLTAGNTAYNAGDFHAAYKNYIEAESAAASILPAPFVVSGTQGTLSPYPLQVTAVAGAKSNIVVTVNSGSELKFTASATASGSVTYKTTSAIGSNQVYVNGSLVSSTANGAGRQFSYSHTAGATVSVEIK